MENIRVEKIESNRYVVKADTKRFGNGVIMFESFSKSECVRYIIRTAIMLYKATKDRKYLSIMINFMSKNKKVRLKNACKRNLIFTSYYGLEDCDVLEDNNGGLYIEMNGVRSRFTVYFDRNGEEKRAPVRKTMKYLTHYIKGYDICNFDEIKVSV